jgi:hypothetical protein
MSIFYDTNVLIGYVFKWDPWHVYSLNSFKDKRKKYWSKTVQEEFNSKIEKMIENDKKFLSLIELKLNNYDELLTKDKLLKIAFKIKIKHRNKESIINGIWEFANLNYEVESEELSYKIENIISEFRYDINSKKNSCKQYLTIHIRNEKYTELKNKLELKIHFPDSEIFLDAHDLCILKEPDLEVITSDAKPENIDYIKKILKINKITDLATHVFK